MRIPSTLTPGPSGYVCSRSYHGRWSETGSSISTLPSSRCCITPIDVKSFEIEHTEYIVEGVAATCVSGCA